MNAAALPVRTRTPRGGGKLLALMLGLFALPFLVVGYLFLSGWRPAQTPHHGELVSTPTREVRLAFDALRDADGRPLPADLAGHWVLLVAAEGPCAAACEARLDEIRRLHVALYKQMSRAKRLWLSTAPTADPALPELRRRWPDLIVAAAPAGPWRELFAADGPRVYVLDPSGRLVMRYAEPFDPRGALRDIDKLLKYSWNG